MACVVDLKLPRITDGLDETWLGMKSQALVVVDFDISAEGRATNVSIVSPTPELSRFTSQYIAQSAFNAQCRGRHNRLTFDFQIVRLPAAIDLPAVSLLSGPTIRMVFAARGASAPLRADPVIR